MDRALMYMTMNRRRNVERSIHVGLRKCIPAHHLHLIVFVANKPMWTFKDVPRVKFLLAWCGSDKTRQKVSETTRLPAVPG